MAKNSGSTRSGKSSSFEVSIENGYDKDRADRMLAIVREIAKEEGIDIKRVEFHNKEHVDGRALANANHRDGVVRFGNLGRRTELRFGPGNIEYEIAAHELGHLKYNIGEALLRENARKEAEARIRKLVRDFERDYNNILSRGDTEKAQRRKEQHERSLTAQQRFLQRMKDLESKVDKKNIELERKLEALHKELSRDHRKYRTAFSTYAVRGGINEMVAEAFAVIKLKQRNGQKINTDGIAYRVYDLVKKEYK